MKAVVCTPDGTVVDDVPDPTPAAGEVVVEVDACGLCGSDVHAVERGHTRPGQILGHEFSGYVAELGSGVSDWWVGAPVAVNPLGSCGKCRACAKGVPFDCPAVPNVGITARGAYAQYVAVPADQLVGLPEDLPVELGACAEPLAVAVNAVRIANVRPGDTALVYGVGSIGLNVIMALRLAHVDTVVAAGRTAGRRLAAAAVGADEVIDTRAVGVTEHAERSGRRYSAVFECSGAPGAVAESFGLLEPGGSCVAVALSGETLDVSVAGIVGNGTRLLGSCAFTRTDYRAAVEHIATWRAPVADIISQRISLHDTPDMLVRLRTPGDLVRVLTKPGS